MRIVTNPLDLWIAERFDRDKRAWCSWLDGMAEREAAIVEAEKRLAVEFAEQLHVLDADARWRLAKTPPTDKQIAFAKRLGIPIPVDETGQPTVTKGQLSDAIDRRQAARMGR